MIFKVLKHKTLPQTFGVLNNGEIWHSTMPDLFGKEATLEDLAKYWKEEPTIVEQLSDYDLVEIYLVLEGTMDRLLAETIGDTIARQGTTMTLMDANQRKQWKQETLEKYFTPELSETTKDFLSSRNSG